MGGKAALILVLGFSFTLGYISLNLNRLANRSSQNMATYNEVTMSHNLASAGANVGLAYLYQNPNKRGVLANQAFTTGTFKGGQFAVRIDSMTPSYIRMLSVSKFLTSNLEYLSDTVEVRFDTKKEQSFSLYGWMTNVEGNVYFITGDTLWGRIHTNDKFRISGSPVFMKKVTAAGGFAQKPGKAPNYGIFKDGYETGIPTIDFPTDLSKLKTAANSGGRRYATEVWVDLDPGTGANKDGWAYVYSDAGMTTVLDSIDLNDPSSFNGALMGDNDVHVQGTLDGALTVSSFGGEIIVEDDILYEQDPRYSSGADDVLGLVAETNVIVADNAANNSDCTIQASVFCRDGSFTAENYKTRPISGMLNILGSIVQDTRGPVGTFSGGSIKSGFLKSYYMDDRLNDNLFRPPFYPGFYTYALRISNWWESVRIPKFQ